MNPSKLTIKTIAGNALDVDQLVDEQFDHILLMGPMYHLFDEADRIKAVHASINLLKPHGVLFVSFINMFAGMVYAMRNMPQIVLEQSEHSYLSAFVENRSFAGMAFTQAYFASQNEILPFMSQFPLEKLHLFGQECITSPCEDKIMSQPIEVIDAWLDLCEKVWEREDLYSFSEHLMYVGCKTDGRK